MRLQFKHQKFQQDATNAVCDIFAGQPYSSINYRLDSGDNIVLHDNAWANAKVQIDDNTILERINKIQRENQIAVSKKLEGKYNLTIEMETGVGKTYTYIKTIFELNKRYGWSKFIIVVPSVAIREGVYKSLQITQEHFAQEYSKKIRFFVYNSQRLNEIESFASDNAINAMIINSQAFNAKGKDARRIYMELDEFRSRKPIDVIAKTNPILIIDEPQSVEGPKTKEGLKKFNPLFILRYSATHKKDSIYNMVYRLDAVEAYNKKLVKRIAVKGITQKGITATEGFVYLEKINLSEKAPTAMLQFDVKGATTIRKKTMKVNEGFNLYDNSGELDEYKNNYVVSSINGKEDYIEFLNGKRVYIGQVCGEVNEEQLRRIQIRETILSHLDMEKKLYNKGIKVLSLFFIDEVSHYKQYDEDGQAQNGIFAKMFEEEYEKVLNEFQLDLDSDSYREYLENISANKTHAGYFSIDKKGRMQNGKISKKENTSEDVDAYDLIMKDKERLLSFDEPVRFIFSHSALREGWDNPNVFQICTLKQSNSEIRKRQEVGRGLRLCVNQKGERMDETVWGEDVQDINTLTIIASESYDSFAKALQNELAEVLENRPKVVSRELFEGKIIKNNKGNQVVIDKDMVDTIYYDLVSNKYIDRKGNLTDKYYEDRKEDNIEFSTEIKEYTSSILDIIDSIYNEKSIDIANAYDTNVELKLNVEKYNMKEFQNLWSRINKKAIYEVEFDSKDFINKAIDALNRKLHVTKIYFKIEKGQLDKIKSKDDLLSGTAFVKETRNEYDSKNISVANSSVKYDLVGKLVEGTGLIRKDIVAILVGLEKNVFNQFKNNPEEFIIKATNLINEEKAMTIIGHVEYSLLDKTYDIDVFTENTLKGKLDVNAMKTRKHLYDNLVYDSKVERNFATELEASDKVAVYVKLPNKFFIPTPVGRYNPDWAIAFYEGSVKHIYFVAETKGTMSPIELRTIEKSKIDCAKKYFEKLKNDDVIYDVVNSYDELLNVISK